MPRRGRVRFADGAKRDLGSIWRYVGERSGAPRADALVRRLLDACETLDQVSDRGVSMPDLGPDVRQIMVASFRVLYRTVGDRIEIARIIHGRRDAAKAWRGSG